MLHRERVRAVTSRVPENIAGVFSLVTLILMLDSQSPASVIWAALSCAGIVTTFALYFRRVRKESKGKGKERGQF